ncbi:hypothetical protein FDV58_18230 [Bradyrhizobium elkanii]|uniref:Uncharacterized protein n=1 Tax=Bradyrhizobium elkanii TaxID=29448 RepID=A0A4U6S2D4_BRAEL|nr:hypothetical protein [Bradyrhizobium elkanii]TKV80172.1 hypothetical protein FDV58_18230 [Bradyrhizobium elkanii]
MTGSAILENVRRYRAIASLCRQAAAFRPVQRISLLTQADEWEQRAVGELEEYFDAQDSPVPLSSQAAPIDRELSAIENTFGASGGS